MDIIAQMTPFGNYNLKYQRKNITNNSLSKPVSTTSATKAYDSLSFLSFLRTQLPSCDTSALQSKYKNDIFSAMSSARSLRDSAERFLQESWPKPTLECDFAVTAKIDADAQYGDHFAEVFALAQNHSYKTNALSANAQLDIAKGTYSVVVEKNDRQQKVVFSLDDNPTARVVAHKLTDAINSLTKNVYAESHEASGNIAFSVNAVTSGEKGRFKLYDDVGDILNRFAMQLETVGSDAEIRVNGRQYKSKNNSVLLDDGKVKLNFSEKMHGSVSIVADNEQALYAVQTLVNSYNNFKQNFAQSENKTGKVETMFNTFAGLFAENDDNEKLGLSLQEETGFLSFDKEIFGANLQSDPALVNKISENNKSLASNLYNMAESLNKNPLSDYFSSFTNSSSEPMRFSGIILDLLA